MKKSINNKHNEVNEERPLGVIICPNCGGKVSTTRSSCIHCGYVIKKKECPACGELLSADVSECPACGYIFNGNEKVFTDGLDSQSDKVEEYAEVKNGAVEETFDGETKLSKSKFKKEESNNQIVKQKNIKNKRIAFIGIFSILLIACLTVGTILIVKSSSSSSNTNPSLNVNTNPDSKETDKEIKVDDNGIPTAISIKVKTTRVQISRSLNMIYTITPSSAQTDNVTVTVSNDLGVVTKVGDYHTIKLTAGNKEGTITVIVTTINGISARKTIKIQKEAVSSNPDLQGYDIKVAQAIQALGEYDVKLTADTKDTYGYYSGSDRDAKLQAWEEIEDNYNCTLSIVAYPSDAPWGPSRWQYILTQAQNEAAEYDFYVIPDSVIPGFVAGNALFDLTDWYAEYGKNLMTEMSITAGTYKGHLYSINANEMSIYNILSYNIGLLKKLQEKDPSIKEPAQMYLDGEWNYNTFVDYCKKVQTALDTYMGTESKYYCLSGYGSYYWVGMVNAGGVKVLDTVGLKANLTGTVEQAAGAALQEIYAAGAMDTIFQVDQNVATWNAGVSLFNTGDLYFVNDSYKWNSTLWGDDTQYGYVPFPGYPENDPDMTYVGTTDVPCIVMAAGREWAYEGYGSDCTAENIYRAFMDYWTTARDLYKKSEDYSYLGQLTATANAKFSSEASVQAFLKIMIGTLQEDGTYKGGIKEYGFYDPFVSNSNAVVGNVGATGTLAGSINAYIRGNFNNWADAVGTYVENIEEALIEIYG